MEATLFETFGADPEPGTIPDEKLDAIAGTIAEGEDMTAQRVLLKLVRDDTVEPIKALPHVGGTGDDEDTGRGAQCDHRGVFRWS